MISNRKWHRAGCAKVWHYLKVKQHCKTGIVPMRLETVTDRDAVCSRVMKKRLHITRMRSNTVVRLRHSIAYYQQRADMADADCQNSLAACYFSGRGVGRDLQKAISMYEKARIRPRWPIMRCNVSNNIKRNRRENK